MSFRDTSKHLNRKLSNIVKVVLFNEFCKSSTLNIVLIHNADYYMCVETYFQLQNGNNIFLHALSNKFKRSKVWKVRSLII